MCHCNFSWDGCINCYSFEVSCFKIYTDYNLNNVKMRETKFCQKDSHNTNVFVVIFS